MANSKKTLKLKPIVLSLKAATVVTRVLSPHLQATAAKTSTLGQRQINLETFALNPIEE